MEGGWGGLRILDVILPEFIVGTMLDIHLVDESFADDFVRLAVII